MGSRLNYERGNKMGSHNKNPPKWISQLIGVLILLLEIILIAGLILLIAFGFLMLFIQPIM